MSDEKMHVPVPFGEEAQQVMLNALTDIVKMSEKGEAAMPMKFICVVEYANAAGETWCMRFGDPNSAVWDRMGLLQFGMICEARWLSEPH